MAKKGGKWKNTIALFFATRFSQLLISGREGARAKQDLDTAVITHSPFISSDRYLFVLEAYFQDHQIHVAPLALDQRQALVRSASNQR